MGVVLTEDEDKNILVDLVTTNPLAWLVSPNLVDATLLPLLPIVDDQQNIVAIEGHMARTNPHIKTLETEKSATILYKGPDSYMPTAWVANKRLAPTWMFSSATFLVDVTLLPAEKDTQEHLKRLVVFMEKINGSSWSVDSMEERFEPMSRYVIGFRAAVKSVNRRFKLGQNEEPDVLKEMVAGLMSADKADIAAWMKRANGRIDW
ncbi:FMN-binding negative transcriptional regulator [Kordiimonas pumila]|uniref:FMN-binding negative transcriptional regulator n=1 Tax=Kordiimonas pumila TaxID=2161677 RepID=A0ABV7D3V4_9PROT|nr:FMN-binding negative transcriptional regulator [Kordiimonas pumila]